VASRTTACGIFNHISAKIVSSQVVLCDLSGSHNRDTQPFAMQFGYGLAEEGQYPVPAMTLWLKSVNAPSRGRRQNTGPERVSLVRAESCLITRFNSLQGRKKFPVRMRRELVCNGLILLLLCAPITPRQGRIERKSLYLPS